MAYKKKNFSPEEKAAYKAKKQSEMDKMIKRIDEGVKAVFESERYKEYLKFASQFTDYSARNTMLINMQKPDATLVAANGKWKELGRHINKGETGIAIFAPTPYKTNEYIETQKPAFDEYGNQLYNEDGTEKMETIETPLTGMAFKTVYVFDISQTDGKEIPEPVSELTGDVDPARKDAVFTAIKKVTGIDVEFQDIKGNSKGYYSPASDKIVIKTGMSDAQTLKTVFHEAAHKLLHDPKAEIVTVKSPRNEKEVQAESVAFMVAEKFGLDTSEYSFPYIASWSEGKQLEQLKNVLQEIQSAAKQISNAIDSELLKMQKRHLSIDEKLADTELNNVQKAEFLIENCSERDVEFSEKDTKYILEFAEQHEDISETVQLVEDMEITQRQRDNYGYDFTYMNAFDSKESALEAFDRGEAVYLLYPDNTEGMALERSEIENFSGYFGVEKEPKTALEQDNELTSVSKSVALEMWDKNSDVFIDGIPADSRNDIISAPDTAKFAVLEYEFSAELDFDRTNGGNTMARNYNNGYGQQNYGQSAPTNPNVIGNTPYNQLGGKGQLQFYTDLKNRHADNIAAQLNADGVRFSGLRKGEVTTITINKVDIPHYVAAVEKVKQSYRQNNAPDRGYPQQNSAPNFQQQSAPTNPNVIGNTPYNQLGGKGQLQFYTDLKNRHADNIANQLNADGVRFSGLRKGEVTTITINKADIPRYEAAVEKVKQSYRQNNAPDRGYSQNVPEQNYQPNFRSAEQSSAPTNPNVIGNTPYNQLGGKNELQFYTNLKNRHADNVAKQLDEDGIKFSGMRKETVTTITIKKSDIPRYEAALAKVKQMYDRLNNRSAQVPETVFNEQPPKPKRAEPPRTDIPEMRKDEPSNFRAVPIYSQSLMEAKQSGNFGAWKDSVAASEACIKFIEDNLSAAYEGRDLENLVKQLDEKFGIDRAMYTVAATVQLKNHDGRFTNAVKENAAQFSFDSDNMRLKFLTERHPVMINHLYQQMMEMEHDLRLNLPQKDETLSANFDGKLLYSSERVELRDDFRGIPETKYYKSSANEFFIPEIGWLDDTAYNRELKSSELTAKDFYATVTRVNANYIDGTGMTGQMDMSRAEYDAMTEKTYAPENTEALKAALGKLDECRSEIKIPEKPTEYYAVRQESNRRFSVYSISADGLTTVVKPNMLSVTEAKKAMLEIFEQRKDCARVELVHPQTLDEISAKMYKEREQLPDVLHRITLNPEKNAAETHVLQEYIKNDDGKYSVGQAVVKGDYEKCNKFLAQLMNAPKIELPAQNYEIYQLKSNEETRDIRFQPYEYITKAGKMLDFNNYEKVYEGKAANLSGNLGEKLESLFEKFNFDRPEDYKGHSLSVSDVVVLDDKACYVDAIGFRYLEDFVPLEVKQSRFLSDLPKRLSDIVEGKVSPLQDNLLKVGNDALALNIPPSTMREAADMLNDERVDKITETYEGMFQRRNAPNRELPKQEQHKQQRKPKL